MNFFNICPSTLLTISYFTKSLQRRMKQYFSPQRRMWWVSQPIVETASFIPVEETQLRKRLEKILIRFLKSNAVMNRTHVRR